MSVSESVLSDVRKRFAVTCEKTAEECVYLTGDLRFSVLSERILRVEKRTEAGFVDLPSQSVICRNFANPRFNVTEKDGKVRIETASAVFVTDKKTLKTRCVTPVGEAWPSARDNLGGTARTLDMTNGRVRIGKGIMSRGGVAEYDDSRSCLIGDDAMLVPRPAGGRDIYVFAFGHDYKGGLKEFFALTGYPPLLPKFVFGNWWSRYHAYSADEYLALMDEFAAKKLPFTVATVDMDWHIVDGVPKEFKPHNPTQCAGWTGYTFNKELFPDHRKFLAELKNRRLAVTFNLHPRDGVRYFEEQYADMARACGIDPAGKKTVEFDLTDPQFLLAYFDILHHPYEDEGVDFWWIDWQQGTKSKMKNADPLWMLNHYHTLDSGRDGRKPLILSRYAGVGSHRYPLGFSGDTIVSWKSLRLQPRFTSTAANVGFTWWSHDIGGHMFGKGDPELYARWVQFGAFSPVNRLHSTKRGHSKEPWLYGEEAEAVASCFLRLRHRMLPYLYAANVATAKEGVPVCRPMYYDYDEEMAYNVPDQYMFGSELLVAPVLTAARSDGFARTPVWFPAGEWVNVFTGEREEGGRYRVVESDLSTFPVYAKAGAIVPLLAERDGNSTEFDEIEVQIFRGDGEFVMHDEGCGGVKFRSRLDGGRLVVTVSPEEGAKTRKIRIRFRDAVPAAEQATGILARDDDSVTVPCTDISVVAVIPPAENGAEESGASDGAAAEGKTD